MQQLRFFLSRVAMGLALASVPLLCAAQASSPQSYPSSPQNGPSTMSASTTDNSGLRSSDKKFVDEAAQGGMAEVELGRLATQKASNDEVKKFGQRMVDDHTKANQQLSQIAGSKGMQLPQDLSSKDKATVDRLSKLSGAEFDKAYMADMVKDHKKDVSAFQHESRSGSDPEIKNFAAQTLPTLQEHLSQAQSIAPNASSGGEAMNNTGSQTSSH